MKNLLLTDDENNTILHIVKHLSKQNLGVESDLMSREMELSSALLPYGLRKILLDMKHASSSFAALRIRGFFIDDKKIGNTPKHWKNSWENPQIREENIFHGIISSALGSIISWKTQESGRKFRNIVALKEDESKQMGGGSKEPLFPHTEEAHALLPPEFIVLFCLRNFENASTNMCAVNDVVLEDNLKKELFKTQFYISHDFSHAFSSREKTIKDRISILYGDYRDPFIRFDPGYMKPEDHSETQMQFIEEFKDILTKNLQSVVLEPGDILIIDNARAVHARSKFNPRYDKKSRWLIRSQVSTNLRKIKQLMR